MFDLMENYSANARIKVMGLGGGGGNAVEHMVRSGIEGVEFICANTDAQALQSMTATHSLHIGANITKGLGAGANPDIGRQAALEDRERIAELFDNTDMLFLTAGMGGGTGTGSIPVVAQLAREAGILTVAVVTKPFPFEGSKRMQVAARGIEELRQHVDSLIIIPNEKLLSVLGKNISLLDAFNSANDVLCGAVQGISELITRPGLINVDFADVNTVMSEMGVAMMGTGIAQGEDRATEAAEQAVSSPLLEDIDLAGAKGILINVTGGMDMNIGEFEEVGNVVKQFASEDATVVVGTVIDPELEGELRVTVVATGLGAQNRNLVGKTVRPGRDGRINYNQLDKPTVIRRSPDGAPATSGRPAALAPAPAPMQRPAAAVRRNELPKTDYNQGAENEYDVLDIPAFLRRQAD